MSTTFLERLEPEEEEKLIGKLSHEIHRRRLETPAILFLEMHKPLTSVAGHAVIGFSPFIAPFVGMDNVAAYSRLLSNRDSYERLIRRLEELRESPAEEAKSQDAVL